MRMCRGCQRHLVWGEPRCPFCGLGLPLGSSVAWAPASVGLVLGLATAGCGPTRSDAAGEGTASTGSTGVDASSTGVVSSTSASASSSGGSTSSSDASSGADSSSTGGATDDGSSSTTSSFPTDCDFWTDLCPDGTKCVPAIEMCPGFYGSFCTGGDWDRRFCADVSEEPANIGEPCSVRFESGIDDCRVGAHCVPEADSLSNGICTAFCEGTPEAPFCTQPDTECALVGGLDVPFCLPICDPNANSCPEGATCTDTPSGTSVCVSNYL